MSAQANQQEWNYLWSNLQDNDEWLFRKLNAPTTHLITEAQARSWVAGWKDAHVDCYVGTSWRLSGTKPE